MASSLLFLEAYDAESDLLLDLIVTGNKKEFATGFSKELERFKLCNSHTDIKKNNELVARVPVTKALPSFFNNKNVK